MLRQKVTQNFHARNLRPQPPEPHLWWPWCALCFGAPVTYLSFCMYPPFFSSYSNLLKEAWSSPAYQGEGKMPFLTFAHLAWPSSLPFVIITSCDGETDCVALSSHSDDGLSEYIFQISLMSIETILSKVVGLPSAGAAPHMPFFFLSSWCADLVRIKRSV